MEITGTNLIARPIEVVGVVHDAKYNDLRADVKPMFYIPIQQFPTTIRSIEVQTFEPTSVVTASVRQAVLEVAPDLMIRRVIPLSGQVDRSLRPERMIANLCVAFGIIALLVASAGLNGVMSYGVAQRTTEIGVRMALGATTSRVLWMILGQSMTVVAGGAIAGIALSLSSTRLIATFLFGLAPTDIETIGGATAVVLFVSAVAAYLPARRAMRVDPMVALRDE